MFVGAVDSRQLIQGTRLVSTMPSHQIPMAIQGVSTELLQFCKQFEALLRAISDVHAPSDIRIVGAGNGA